MPVPDFSPGEILTASAMDSIGLWLVKTQTIGTAVTSVTVTNAFTTDYDSYYITATNTTTTSSAVVTFQLSGLTTGYYGNIIFANLTGGTPASNGYNNAAQVGHGGSSTNGALNLNMTVINPFLARPTIMSAGYVDAANAGVTNAFQNSSTSTTGFTITLAAGTMTGGTIRVYGYRK